MEKKGLFIYIGITFAVSWAYFLLFMSDGADFVEINSKNGLVGLGMLIPFLSCLLTRWITKEGFAVTGSGSLMLGINLKNKKWKYYLIAMFLPWLYFELSYLIVVIIFPQVFDAKYYVELGMPQGLTFIYPLAVIIQTAIISFAALGEEGGWRGYMMPKLTSLLGYKKAIVIGGIIWGVWHAPLTCIGHNFGKNYPGFPYVGIIFMCFMCTFMGIILNYITIKTKSIWPAAIMHAVNNGSPCIISLYINPERYEQLVNPLAFMGIYILVLAVIAIIFFVLTKREYS